MNRSRKIIAVGVISTIGILGILIGIMFFSGLLGTSETIEQHIPNEGEERKLMIHVEFYNSTKVGDVHVMISNTETGKTANQTSEENGLLSFSANVGVNYLITATSNNSTKSIVAKIGPLTDIYVIISPFDKTIEHIAPFEVGIA